MPQESNRPRRVGDQIRRELAELLAREVADPRLSGVVINDVEVSRDLANARIYFVTPTGSVPEQVVDGLRAATGFLRRALAGRLRLRIVPQLRFERDTTMDSAERIEQLLAAAARRDEPAEGGT